MGLCLGQSVKPYGLGQLYGRPIWVRVKDKISHLA